MEIDCPSCSEAILIADDELAEGIECPFCQQKIELQKADSEDRNSESTGNDGKQLPPSVDQKTADLNTGHSKINKPHKPIKEYKILTQKDKWFSKKFDPELLEDALNAYVKQGWEVKTICTASFPGFVGGTREEMIVVLERDALN